MSNTSEDSDPTAGPGDPQGNSGEKKDGDKKDADKPDKKEEPGKARKFFTSPPGILLIIAVVVLLIIAGFLLWRYEKNHESTIDAYTAGRTHQVSPRVQRLAIELWVDDNQQVAKGDLLIKLDPRDYEVGRVGAPVASITLPKSKP